VREQLVLLLQLQQSDIKVRELQTAVNQLPTKLDPLRRDLAKLQGMLDGERGKLNETNSWRKSQQEMIDRERDALRQAQGKFQASKNTKEFNAASREVENKRKSIGDREAELKKMVEASAASNAQLDSRDKDVGVLHTRWGGDGDVTLTNGFRAEWMHTNFWRTRWSFQHAGGREIVHFTPNHKLLKAGATVEIPQPVAPNVPLPMLTLLGWYLMVLMAQDAAVAAAAAG